jgi:serine/threonine protein phosphatase 1
MPRLIAIGDVHGCSTALAALIELIEPLPEDVLVFLGDLIDRGPDSRGVLDQVLGLTVRCGLRLVRGDHEDMLLGALHDEGTRYKWLKCGGEPTLRSYGWVPGGPKRPLSHWIPASHQMLLATAEWYYETPTHIFIHAGYEPDTPLADQSQAALIWRVMHRGSAKPHCSGKVVVVGHTPQLSGEILDLGFQICIDTNCARGGWLTALDVISGQVWQADESGLTRKRSFEVSDSHDSP